MINVLQFGLGPLGVKIAEYIAEREGLHTVAVVDNAAELQGMDLHGIVPQASPGVRIVPSIDLVSNIEGIDIVILTTVSDIGRIYKQIIQIIDLGLPIVSTCEELVYPWLENSDIAKQIDENAKNKKVAVLGTGVNPGFLMDALACTMTGVCQSVDHVTVHRFQDAESRRIPFQKKIGAGLTLKEFDKRKQSGRLRHVGLTESMHMIASSIGWKVDRSEDVISPIIAEHDVETDAMIISEGNAMGVRQVGRAFLDGKEKIELVFEAAVGSGQSYDRIVIDGTPSVDSTIKGGVNGDIATCAIVLNAIPQVLKANPGLRTMADIGIVSYWQ